MSFVLLYYIIAVNPCDEEKYASYTNPYHTFQCNQASQNKITDEFLSYSTMALIAFQVRLFGRQMEK